MPREKSNIIKVLGFGGGGGNAVNHMFTQNIQNVDFVICNTDSQALQNSPIPNKIQLGPHLTQGLGAGANPEIGKQATEESLEEIRRILEVNTKMAFITAGMGGGTGTGGAPTVAKICRDLGILTVGIVTTPFQFEGPRRMAQAKQGIAELKEHVDTLLVISNDKLRHQFGNLKMKEAFAKADDVLTTAARCITDVINSTGQINVDFADVCTVMRNGGVAILGSALESGEGRALRAIEAATNSPLLNDNDIKGAKWILLNICSSEGEHEYTMDEVETIQEYVRKQTGEQTDVILGMGYDSTLGENLAITIIATGFAHKDPFEKPAIRKVETRPEPQIIMTLGVEGEEKKMEFPHQVSSAPVVDTTPPVPVEAPVLRLVEEPPTTEPVQAPAVPTFVPTVPEPVQDDAIVFELHIEPETLPEQPIADKTIEDVSATTTTAWEESVQEELPLFLSKPSVIYHEPAAPAEEPVMKSEPVPPAKEELNESLRPMMSEEWNEEEMAISGITLSIDEPQAQPAGNMHAVNADFQQEDLSEDEEQKRRAKERINRLRNLSFNPQHLDNTEFDQVPAYLRRDMDLHNSIANVEDFYSRAQVKTDDNNNTSISTLNNFLHGDKPD